MENFRLDNVLKITKIENEFELEQANSLFNRLRLLVKDDPSLSPLRHHLADLIEAYENEHWSDVDSITDEQVKESEQAEKMAQFQTQFIQRRKERIRSALNKNDLNQNDLAEILGHRKNYMSELINGVRPFSKEDIVVIHRVLGIEFNDLILPLIKEPTAERIRLTLAKMNKPQLKLKDEDLQLI